VEVESMKGWEDDLAGDTPAATSKAWSLPRSLMASLVLGSALIAVIRAYPDEASGEGPGPEASCRAAFRSRRGPITCLVWSPDGSTLAASSWGPSVTLLDAASGRRRSIGRDDGGPLFPLGWTPDGRSLAVSGFDGAVEMMEVGPGSGEGRAGPPRISVCPGTSLRLFGSSDRRSEAFLPPSEPPMVLAFRPDGRAAASGSADGLVRVWGPTGDRERLRFRFAPGARETGGVNSIAFSPDGATLATAGVGGIRLWDPASGASKGMLGGGSPGFGVVAFSADGGRIAVASWTGALQIWDVASGRPISRMAGHDGRTLALAWSPDGRTLASGGYDGQVRLWDAPEVVGNP